MEDGGFGPPSSADRGNLLLKKSTESKESVLENSIRMVRQYGLGYIFVDQSASLLSKVAFANSHATLEYDWLRSVIDEARKIMMCVTWIPAEPAHFLMMARTPESATAGRAGGMRKAPKRGRKASATSRLKIRI